MLEAWRRLAPSIHYPPLPYAVLLVMVDTLWRGGEWEMGLYLWLSHHCLLRPGEAFRMKVRDVVLAIGWEALLAGGTAVVQIPVTKTGKAVRMAGVGDEGVFRPKQVTILDRALAVLLWWHVAGRPADAPLFCMLTQTAMARRFKALVQSLGLAGCEFVPRSLRPGGACFFHVDHHWSVADLLGRGVWAQYESTRAYFDTAKYQLLALRVPPPLMKQGEALAERWPRGVALPATIDDDMPRALARRFELTLQRTAGWGLEDVGMKSSGTEGPARRRGMRR
jgi:hypothetical protein